MIREGYIEKIVYKSDETGYCVMSLSGIKILKLHLQDNKEVVESVTVDMLEPKLENPEQFLGESACTIAFGYHGRGCRLHDPHDYKNV